MNEIVIRDYRDEDEQEWMRVHAVILSISHSWNYSIQQRPVYTHDSIRIVATIDEKIVGLMDVEIESEPGAICLLKDSIGGYVLEFGRLPEYAGMDIGVKLTEGAKDRMLAKGLHRLEFWSQEPRAQKYYVRHGMKEINRHYRFRMKPTQDIVDYLKVRSIGCEYLYCACVPEVFDEVKGTHEILERHPLEPHLCIGYEIRF